MTEQEQQNQTKKNGSGRLLEKGQTEEDQYMRGGVGNAEAESWSSGAESGEVRPWAESELVPDSVCGVKERKTIKSDSQVVFWDLSSLFYKDLQLLTSVLDGKFQNTASAHVPGLSSSGPALQ